MAPEIALNAKYNVRVDIYSLGVIFYEMCSGVTFMHEIKNTEFVRRVIEGQERPSLDISGVGQEVLGVIKKCWCADMQYRPTARAALEILEARRAEVDRSTYETATGALMSFFFSHIY